MKIAVVGSGNMGAALAGIWSAGGHDVALSYSRDAAKLAAKASAAGARAASVAEAVAGADVVFVSVPWVAAFDAADQVNAALPAGGRPPVVSCVQALNADMSGLLVGTDDSASEQIARRLPDTPVAFALFPFAELLAAPDRSFEGTPGTVFHAADDELARKASEALADAASFASVYVGGLAASRSIEPFGLMLMGIAYGQGRGGQIGVQLLERAPAGAPA